MGLFNRGKKTETKHYLEAEPENRGIYIDAVKRPVRNRPVPVATLRATAKRQKRNEDARRKRAQLRQLNKLTIAVKGS
jgi:hypothetical protein